jgi:Zn-dependent protease/predicted transcriptional regulator
MTLRPVGGIPVARIWGMEIRIHLVWVLILAVITVVASTEAGDLHPEWSSEIRWAIGLLAAFSFLASVLVHELAHAFAARRRGLPVGPITLLFFGGGSSVDQAGGRARDEAWVAAAGPLTSLTIGLVLAGVAIVANDPRPGWVQAAFLLGVLNATLGLLHLIPAYPLDGGRVLRAVVWAYTGDERRGSRVAVLVGRATGYLLIGLGLAVSLYGDPLNSVMLVVSGWFLGSAARGLDRRAAVEDLLEGLRVDEVMERDMPSVAPQLTLDTFAGQYMDSPEASSLAVMRGDSLLGLIGISELRRIARRRWPTTRAEQVMVAAPALPVLAPELPMRSGLEQLRRTGLDGLPVSRGAELLGVLTRRSVVAAIQRRAGEQGKGPPSIRRPWSRARKAGKDPGTDDPANPPAEGA